VKKKRNLGKQKIEFSKKKKGAVATVGNSDAEGDSYRVRKQTVQIAMPEESQSQGGESNGHKDESGKTR